MNSSLGQLRAGNHFHVNGAVAQLGEHLLCKQGVAGSIPVSSTKIVVQLVSRSIQS